MVDQACDKRSTCCCNGMVCTAKVPIFAALSNEDLQKVNALITRYAYKKGDIILRLGSVTGKFMLVKTGRIKIVTVTPEGREQILYILTPGDFFGERYLLCEKTVSYYAQAMENSMVCTIGKEDFEPLVNKHPHIVMKVLEGLCDRLDHMEALVKTISPKDVNLRISMLLIDLSHRYGQQKQDGIIIEIPMSREEMANYIGVARETLIRKLTSLRENGVIEFVGHKRMKIKDIARLETDIRNTALFI